MGDKKKVRAAAGAGARNKVALLNPCHRVIASDGKLSGYRWGTERKKKLLEVEALSQKVDCLILDSRSRSVSPLICSVSFFRNVSS